MTSLWHRLPAPFLTQSTSSTTGMDPSKHLKIIFSSTDLSLGTDHWRTGHTTSTPDRETNHKLSLVYIHSEYLKCSLGIWSSYIFGFKINYAVVIFYVERISQLIQYTKTSPVLNQICSSVKNEYTIFFLIFFLLLSFWFKFHRWDDKTGKNVKVSMLQELT